MKDLLCELKKMDMFSGIDCAKRIHELYKEFPNDRRQIDKYIENRVNATIASADKTIAMAMKTKRQLEEEYAEEYAF